MDRRERGEAAGPDEEAPALAGHAELPTEERLGCCRAEEDEELRLDDGQLGFEPGSARGDLARARLRVDAPCPAGLPLEVLDGVRDVGLGPRDAGLRKRL